MSTPETRRSANPCFGPGATARPVRRHLPVAPRAGARTRFSPETATPEAIGPYDAMAGLAAVLAEGELVEMVGITGPGDPLLSPGPTLETLRLVREKLPDMPLCLTSLGMGAEGMIDDLATLGLAHVTLLIDAVNPKIAEEIYAWIRPGTRTLPLPQAAEMLVAAQAKALVLLRTAGIPVKVNTTVYPGINDHHVEAIAQAVAGLGAAAMALIPYRPHADGEGLPPAPTPEQMEELRAAAAKHLPLMPAFEECGETPVAVGFFPGAEELCAAGAPLPKATKDRPNVAVCSSDGFDVNLHLGQTTRFLIYGPKQGTPELLGTREAPQAPHGDARWEALAETLKDCFALLAANAGSNPRAVLSRLGLRILLTDGNVEGAVDVLYGGGKKGGCKKK
ncbi:MAG: NifB/NifX family molybdenum-iron cluster-binding protein [Desulfovibrionaceae bacterium]